MNLDRVEEEIDLIHPRNVPFIDASEVPGMKFEDGARQILLGLTILVGLSVTCGAAEGLPNILVLYADDLGYGDLSGQNSESKIPTPNLDRLAAEGIRFTDGHSSSGICTPSRYALLTGRYHWRDFHGIVGPLGGSVFKPNQLTLPKMLQERGYATACIGKWHLGWDWNAIRKTDNTQSIQPQDFDWTQSVPKGPLDQGFDHYFGDTVINFPPYAWIQDDRLVEAPDTLMDPSTWKKIKEGNWECRPGPMVTGWDPYQVLPTLARKGVEYLRNRKGQQQPFFLYFAFPCPHAPIIPNDEFDGRSQAGPYGDFVVQTDDVIGRLLQALEEAGLSGNTLVIFTADNGPERYAYARDGKFQHWSARPFRGLKRDIYEGGHHVPFLVRWPGVVEPNQTCDALISQVDLMATIASIVDYELPEDAAHDSHDQLPLFQGKVESVRSHHVHNTNARGYAMRFNEWLLIDAKSGYVSRVDPAWIKRYGYPQDDSSAVELYDLANDPGQKHNVAAANPKRVKQLKQQLEEIKLRGHSAPRLRKE
jgi:arylsulfatase A